MNPIRFKAWVFLAALILSQYSLAQAFQPRGTRRVADIVNEHLGFAESHALILGVSDYTGGWAPLPGVRVDVDSIQSVLEHAGFVTHRNAAQTRVALDSVMGDFLNRYGFAKDNRLLVYFAGHGYTEDSGDLERGYIVPSDAPLPSVDRIEFRRKAISMNTIRSYAQEFDARHVLFVFDACFAGTVFSGSRGSLLHLVDMINNPVRQFITSGSANETVPDQSIFRVLFADGIRGAADLTGDRFVTATELGIFLKQEVKARNPGQTPQEGKLLDPPFDKGEFVFVLSDVDTTMLKDLDSASLLTGPVTREMVQRQRDATITTKGRVDRMGHGSDAYRNGEAAEQRGFAALDADSLETALEHFDEAESHFADATVFALRLRTAIDSTRSRFEEVVRGRDVEGLRRLFVNMDQDDVKGWRNFFRAAKDISVQTAERNFEPFGDKVTLELWVDLSYRNNANATHEDHYRYKWQLAEIHNTWQVVSFSSQPR